MEDSIHKTIAVMALGSLEHKRLIQKKSEMSLMSPLIPSNDILFSSDSGQGGS
jgi:hypothetical protein